VFEGRRLDGEGDNFAAYLQSNLSSIEKKQVKGVIILKNLAESLWKCVLFLYFSA